MAMALGLGALGLLVWTRASDMPETHPTSVQAPLPARVAPEVSQSFPAAIAPSLRHISAVLAFDAIAVGAAGDAHGPPSAPLEPGAQVAPGSQVTFQLYNRSQQPAYFLLFGVDAQQQISWLYPPLHASGGANRSLPFAPMPLIELPEPVSLPHDVKGLTLVGVFTDAPVTIDEVKQAWQQGGAAAVQATLHAQVQSLPLNSHQR